MSRISPISERGCIIPRALAANTVHVTYVRYVASVGYALFQRKPSLPNPKSASTPNDGDDKDGDDDNDGDDGDDDDGDDDRGKLSGIPRTVAGG